MTLNTMGLYMIITSELCFPSTRPGTRFTDGWAGGLKRKILLHRDSNQCPLGYEPRTLEPTWHPQKLNLGKPRKPGLLTLGTKGYGSRFVVHSFILSSGTAFTSTPH